MLIDAPQRVEVGGLEVPNGEGHGAIVAGREAGEHGEAVLGSSTAWMLRFANHPLRSG